MCGLYVGPGEYAKLESTGLLSCFLIQSFIQLAEWLTMLVDRVSQEMFTKHLGIGPKEGREGGKEVRWVVVGCAGNANYCPDCFD